MLGLINCEIIVGQVGCSNVRWVDNIFRLNSVVHFTVEIHRCQTTNGWQLTDSVYIFGLNLKLLQRTRKWKGKNVKHFDQLDCDDKIKSAWWLFHFMCFKSFEGKKIRIFTGKQWKCEKMWLRTVNISEHTERKLKLKKKKFAAT